MKPFKSFLSREFYSFIAYRKGLGYSDDHIGYLLLVFDKYLRRQPGYSNIWEPQFYLKFRNEIKLESSTVNNILYAVRCFFEYLRRKQHHLNNPVKDLPSLPQRAFIPFIFSPQQVEQLLDVVCLRIRHKQRVFFKDLSEYLAILLLARCGLRINEPLRLMRENYRPGEKTIYIEKTKFKKDRLIPIPKFVAQRIDNYLSSRATLIEHDINPYLFIGGIQNRLGDQRIRFIFHDVVRQIGINSPRKVIADTTFGNPTPHSLRHSFAINTLKSAIARKQSPRNVLPVLAAYMGHVEYRHTMKYLRVVDAKSRTLHGINRICKRYLARVLSPKRLSLMHPVHSFRHSCAVRMVSEGEPISKIKNRLGHSNVQSTMVYLQLDLNQKRQLQEDFIRFTRQHLKSDPKIDELIQWENKIYLNGWTAFRYPQGSSKAPRWTNRSKLLC